MCRELSKMAHERNGPGKPSNREMQFREKVTAFSIVPASGITALYYCIVFCGPVTG